MKNFDQKIFFHDENLGVSFEKLGLETLGYIKEFNSTDFWATATQKEKSKVVNESHQTASQEITESVTLYDKNK